MNVVMKIVLTLVMMLVWGIGKEVAQKLQGSGFGFMTLIVSLVCTWVIYDIWFGSFIFSKKSEKSNSPVKNDTVNESYLKTINNMSHSMPEKQVDVPVQTHQQDSLKQSESIMNNNEYSKVINEDELYLQATQEVDEGNQDKALWAKCMALCEGDENKAKYKYIKERVDRLRDEKLREIEEERMKYKKNIDNMKFRSLDDKVKKYLDIDYIDEFKKILKQNGLNVTLAHEVVQFYDENGTFRKFQDADRFVSYFVDTYPDIVKL